MELKQLDINEFYREENAYYIKKGMSVPEGLGSLILITPKQTIGVYNIPGLDNSKEMVDGLGSHGETLDDDTLKALKELVIPTDKYYIKNQKYEERTYLYREEKKSFRR